jgi:hypothetical protein
MKNLLLRIMPFTYVRSFGVIHLLVFTLVHDPLFLVYFYVCVAFLKHDD